MSDEESEHKDVDGDNGYEPENETSNQVVPRHSTNWIPIFLEESEKRSDLDILLLGKTGNGKSSVGNTILGKRFFKSYDSAVSVTTQVEHRYSKVDNRVIKVVDAPGVLDTKCNVDLETCIQDMIEKMHDAVLNHTQGYHAVLIVLRYGTRFTPEDIRVIEILKKIFGPNLVKYYCILVMTCGDNYRSKNSGKKFKTWCSEQTGVFANLYKECGNRAVLFDNNTDDRNIIHKQMKKLITMIDNLHYDGRRYSDEIFQAYESQRCNFILELKEPKITVKTLEDCKAVMQKLEKLKDNLEPEEQLIKLQEMLLDVKKMTDDVDRQDNRQGVLKQALKKCSDLQMFIHKQIETAKIFKDKQIMENQIQVLQQELTIKIDEMHKTVESSKEYNQKLVSQIKQLKNKIADYQSDIKKCNQELAEQERKYTEVMNKMKENYESTITEMTQTRIQLEKKIIELARERSTKKDCNLL